MVKTYQFVFIIRPTLSDTERKKLIETIKTFLKTANVVKIEEWGQKVLAYPIKREESGFYVSLTLEGHIKTVEFEKKLHEHENVLRSLLLGGKEIRGTKS